MPQSILASHVGCTYIGLYINDLRVHFDATYIDENKGFPVANAAQRFYETRGQRTQVLAASLTSIEEVMMLSGVAHITVSPPLLYELSETSAETWEGDTGAAFKTAPAEVQDVDAASARDEAAWRLTFSKDKDGKSEAKLKDAVQLFSEKQDALEALVASYF
ncbi:hypothetical protein NPX13_g11334 [Xylaria arbuscula]|uniref:Transaldolase n=1 Tax=Xylaria arbuscula TaxID=114810 RepID=A0A9W8N316_9PEZI|nr:hypothetical protein NPX13_g11334 [Xylaria arbuscula]